ncbi:ABC transporter substrate-binding protein [Marinomonas pollencensis]|uniref:Glycine betaine/proline transport system substrate-binding protein n=1 Tax=Marinomonas pollencensis TaxID=491954 RepID=A0A3E0DRC8_9GAMM|nr:ABC transporter substrate-binding protein [Marinomonas pollencensis]REG85660.1 glycine betaine/proline transport system substrate-binding protein [Marinomonas pollencensis]
MKILTPLVPAMLVSAFSAQASAAACGSFTIADMNWNSASLIAHVDQFILNNGYQCDAELIPGDSVPTGISMIEKGQPDVAPELWTNSVKEALDKGVADKRLRYAGNALVNGGEEGFWVPAYLVKEYPEMATIEGVIKHADLFKHPESNTKHAFYSCPAGWTCQITAEHLFNALKLADDGFEIIDPGSGAGLAGSISRAYERKQPWFGYYWSPTPVLGKYEMVKVDFGSGTDVDEYRNCTTQPNCQSPKVTMYPPSPVHTITTESFAQNEPEAYGYFEKRGFTNPQMSKLLAWMEDNQADEETAMYYFLETYPDIWQSWVSTDVAKKVESAL